MRPTAWQLGADSIEKLAPGKQTCPAHYHLLEEARVYGIEGGMTLRLAKASGRGRVGPAPQCLMKGAAAPACFFCCLIVFFSFGVCCGFFLLAFGG